MPRLKLHTPVGSARFIGWGLGLIAVAGLMSLVVPTGRAGPDGISTSKTQVVAEDTPAVINVQQQKATYRYDDLNRLVEIINEDGTLITYTYDPAGNLMQTVMR
jgi:YD repeat-containing protein